LLLCISCLPVLHPSSSCWYKTFADASLLLIQPLKDFFSTMFSSWRWVWDAFNNFCCCCCCWSYGDPCPNLYPSKRPQ
jgi:hypothetical protein